MYQDKVGQKEQIDFLSREERTRILNREMRGAVPAICIERARLVTESYKQTEGMPSVLQRAHAVKYLLEHMTLRIEKEELIVGNHGTGMRAAPLFPEYGIFSKQELDMMPTRKVDTLMITEADKKVLLEEIYPYWEKRSVEAISEYYINDKIRGVLKSPYRVFNPLSRTRSGYGHYLPDLKKVIEHGFVAIEEEVSRYMEQLSPLDADYVDKSQFYNAVLLVISGIRNYQLRYSRLARDMAEKEVSERRKRELLLIAKNCDQVPYRPARTFYEALQSYYFTILIDYCTQNGSAISGGRIDQFFYPFYCKDLGNGSLTKEEALELLEALWVKHSDIIKAGTYMSARNNGGFATTVNVVLGGTDDKGNDVVNELSYLCLDAEEHVFNSEPNTSIRVSAKNPDAFIKRVLTILVNKEGGKMPFFNDEVIIPALKEDGVSHEDAADYALVGCVEPTGQGNTMGRSNCCYFNLAKCLELALFDGVCQLSGEQLGPRTGKFTSFQTFNEFLEAYERQVDYFVEMMIASLNSIELLHSRFGQEIVCSMLLEGCIETGRDCTCGGAKYNYSGLQGVGVVDVGDSLTTIYTAIFKEHMISPEKLLLALRADFEDCEPLRQKIINKIPKYGNDNIDADRWTAYAGEQYCKSVSKYTSPLGAHYRPGLFCLSSNTPLGRQVAALPSGRKAKLPLGDGGISPKHGMDLLGPTAVAKSAVRIDHKLAVNGVNLNMKFLPSMLETEEDKQKLVDFIRGYFSMGGMHIQFNVLTSEKLKDAQKHPEQYRGLVVRVAGYSAFFVELDEEIQNEIIARTQQGE